MEQFSFNNNESPSFIESNDRNLVNNKSQSENCNLIVNYLPQDIDDSQLQDIFAEHGEIVQAKVVRDKTSKKSLGYGFVKYTNYEDAATAVSQKNRYMVGSKVIKVSFARTSSEEIKNCKLYITNIPRAYMEMDVINLFACFGNIIECRVLKDHSFGTSKGVAFVQFNLRSEANQALSLNGIRVEGSDRPLIVKYAEDQSRKNEESAKRQPQLNSSSLDPYYPISIEAHHLHAANNLAKNMPTSTYTIPQIQAYLPAPSPLGYTYGSPYKYIASPAQVISQAEWYQQQHQQQQQLPINFLVPEVVRYPQQQQHDLIRQQQQQLQLQSQFSSYQQLQTEQQSQQQLLYSRQFEAQMQKSSKLKSNPLHLGFHQQQQQQQQQSLRKNTANMAPQSATRDVMVTVKGIPSEADVLSLHQFFSHYGTVLGLDLDVDEAHKARINKRTSEPSADPTFVKGIIKFSDMDAARLAMAELNSGNILYNNTFQLQVELLH